jgi:diaminopimelate epimerase
VTGVQIPFTKAHGALNDFLLTWAREAGALDRAAVARAICHRHAGIGADGWIVVSPAAPEHAEIELWNADGSRAELSGNGTRCAAAWLVDLGLASEHVQLRTGAGRKELRLLSRRGAEFAFEMNMGTPAFPADAPIRLRLRDGEREAVLVDVGNPQCAFPVENFDFDWRAAGAEAERHSRFPNRTNVSFFRVTSRRAIEVRFWERGAGETMSSGTGSTGAVAAAARLGLVDDEVTVETPAGPLSVRRAGDYYLTGPAVLIGSGRFTLPG